MVVAPPVDPLAAWIAAALIAALFAHAAIAKLADRARLEHHLAAYGVPQAAVAALAWALPLLEGVTAGLVLTPWRPVGAVAAAALLLAYAAVMAWQRAHGRVLDCGCGGAPLAVSWALVARNVLLAALAGLAAAPPAPRALGLADFIVVVAAVMLATLLHAACNEVLRHGQRARSDPFLEKA